MRDDQLAPWVDLWRDWSLDDELEPESGGLIERGIETGTAGARGAEVAGTLSHLDVEGIGVLVRLVTHTAQDAVVGDWAAERFVVEVTRRLIDQHPLLPRLAVLLELDGIASDACGADLPRGVYEEHRAGIRGQLDRVADQLRAVIRSRPEVLETYTREYLESLGVVAPQL